MLYRVYFNRLNAAPLIWSIDAGTQSTEVNVRSVSVIGCDMETKCDLLMPVNQDHPKAWLEVRGELRIVQGIAVITGSKE